MTKVLIIRGNANDLKFLDNDIKLIEEAFHSIGAVTERLSGDKYYLQSALGAGSHSIGMSDTLIIYFTGHGRVKSGDVELKVGLDDTYLSWLSLSQSITECDKAPVGKIVFILDCCCSGAGIESWKKYATSKTCLFLASNNLGLAKELDEFHASFFTYCIYECITKRQDALYKDGMITLSSLCRETQKFVRHYNNEHENSMPSPTLVGVQDKEILLGHSKSEETRHKLLEEKIIEYLNGFLKCIETCQKDCYSEYPWCGSLFRLDLNVLQYVIPTIKDFYENTENGLNWKLDHFFENWFTKNNNYLCLLGDMGVGKTSACIYLMYYLSKKYNGDDYRYIPVFFALEALTKLTRLEKNVHAIIGEFMGNLFTEDEIKELYRQRRIVFILDGFDEISGDSSLGEILHNYEKLKPFLRLACKTVLTCRTHYFSEQEQLQEVLTGQIEGTDFAKKLMGDEYPFHIIEIQEFSEDEILELISLLLPRENSKKIWDDIGQIYDLSDLAKRALLLKMIVNTLPELRKKGRAVNSNELYMTYTRKLLVREMRWRKIGLNIAEKERFIAYIASLMYINNTLVIETKKFDKEIMTFFKDSIYDRDQLNNYRYDCKVANFFSRDRQDNYRFIHKSFYEYYFAMYCIQQLSENETDAWCHRWFPREIACFIKESLSVQKHHFLIQRLMEIVMKTDNSTLIWNALHIISLLDEGMVKMFLTGELKQEFIRRGEAETDCVIIRQYCRVIAKFIDRGCAERLIDKVIQIARHNEYENAENDRTYDNYYGGRQAACNAFIRHLSVEVPKYDAKLHLYLLEHLASSDFIPKIRTITDRWENLEQYQKEVDMAICGILTGKKTTDALN